MQKYRIQVLIVAWVIAGGLVIAAAKQEGAKSEFSRTTIDVGVVVSDIDRAVKFYTEALGFSDAGRFEVPAQMATDTGLTDQKPFQVRVLALGKEPAATKLKVMQIPGTAAQRVDNRDLGSCLGIRYLTVFVSDLGRTMERLQRQGIAPVKPPYRLSGGNNDLILVKDPDGNIIELIGPRP
ncbi:MAG: VOC family protein [Planctomycetes bacterium]|jgi:lactoylglutathione lyase|nr:VOC family protein [Planctomycetota bacterium]